MQGRGMQLAALAAAALLMLSGTLVLATHESQGLGSALQARGNWNRGERTAFLAALAAQGRAEQSEVAVIRATLDADGYTNWHGHPGPSVVVVTEGTLTVLEPTAAGRCREREFGPGSAFFHASDNHDFRNNGTQQVVFYITYFVTAWPPLVHFDDPGTCG